MSEASRENRQWLLAARPVGMVKQSDFELRSTSVPEPGAQQLLVRNRWLAFEPAMRGWPDVLNRLAVASRQIGYGWVTGATIAKTPLMRMSRDTEVIRRYVLGLLNFLFRIFEERRPDLVFCYVVAEAPAYGMSKVSEHFGVPFRRLTSARMGNQYIIDDSPETRRIKKAETSPCSAGVRQP